MDLNNEFILIDDEKLDYERRSIYDLNIFLNNYHTNSHYNSLNIDDTSYENLVALGQVLKNNHICL